MKLYIAILDEFPDYMTPTLVAHAVLSAHEIHKQDPRYQKWWSTSYRKCVVRVNQKEFDQIARLPHTCQTYEKTCLDARMACAIPVPVENEDLPNVLKFAKLWKPKPDAEPNL